MNTQSGIYEIANTVNGKRYIGSAVNLARRFIRHRHDLARGQHHNHYLQRAWDKYGAGAFEFRPVLLCERPELISWEQKYIDGFLPEYNLSPSAGSVLGMKLTPEARAKISAANKGAARSEEARAKIGAASRGRIPSAETRAKMSASRTGKKFSPERRARMSAARKGKKQTSEARARMSADRKGKPGHPQPSETRAKIGAANRGKVRAPFSAEWRAK